MSPKMPLDATPTRPEAPGDTKPFQETFRSRADTPAESQEAIAFSEATRPQILARLRERIVAFAASRYARDSAEDLAQEVLVVIHEKYSHVERLEDLLPLSMQILRFKLAAFWRKAARHGEYNQVDPEEYPLAGDAPDPETVLARKEMLAHLSKGIASMGQRCQELFRHKLMGKTFPEIRELMGADALNTVYTWDHRCRKQLLERMGGRWK